MTVDIEDDTKHLESWRARVRKGEARRLMKDLVERAASSGTEVLVARADMIFGQAHLRTALWHARRSMSERTNASDSLAMETLLYASGERQLSTAIKKMSVDDATEAVVVAKLTEGTFSPEPSWEALPDTDEAPDPARLRSFGISDKEIATMPGRDLSELVLERVAAVDLTKK